MRGSVAFGPVYSRSSDLNTMQFNDVVATVAVVFCENLRPEYNGAESDVHTFRLCAFLYAFWGQRRSRPGSSFGGGVSVAA